MTIPWAQKQFTPKCIQLELSCQDIERLLLEIPCKDAIDIICEVIATDKAINDAVRKWINEP